MPIVPESALAEAIAIAVTYHCGQTDKAGIEYVTHPLRCMSMFVLPEEGDERIVAALHDIVEDTGVTMEFLTARGFSPAVVEAIDAISRRKDESYADYIERVAQNPLATRVKLADLRDNLDGRRHSTGMLSEETKRKYQDAHDTLVRRQWAAEQEARAASEG